MFRKKKRQIATWELVLMATTCAVGMVGGDILGLIVVFVLALIVGACLIFKKTLKPPVQDFGSLSVQETTKPEVRQNG